MMDKEKVLSEVVKKYEKFDIKQEEIQKYLNLAEGECKNDAEAIKKISILLDSYIVRNDINLDVIKSSYNYLKKLIKSDGASLSKISKLANDDKVSIDSKINEIYNQVINTIKENYDSNKLLSQNIIERIKQFLQKDKVISVDRNEEFDITFLKRLNGINVEIISKATDIPASTLYGYINLNKKVPGYNFARILEYFNVKNYDELKELSEKRRFVTEVLKRKPKIETSTNKFDISILKAYLLKNNVMLVKLQILLSMNKEKLTKCLTGEELVTDDIMNEIYKLFEVNGYDELVTRIRENTLKIPSRLKPECYDISFLNKFITLNDIDKTKLADTLEINKMMLSDYLNGKKAAQVKLVDKLIDIFGLLNFYDLKVNANNNTLNIPIYLLKSEKENIPAKNSSTKKEENKEIINNPEKINKTEEPKKEIKNDKIEVVNEQKTKTNAIASSTVNNVYTNNTIPNILNMIKIDELLKLIVKENISNSDYMIVLLLFGGVEDQYFKISSISKFLHINEEYINNIYTKCLELYKNKLNDELKKEKTMILEK